MSRFSGKCDFCDEIEICGLDHVLNCNVYLGDNDEPLRLTCLEDCIPYYPHIVVAAGIDNVKKTGMIRLSQQSWVDIEEARYGHLKMHDVFREELQKELAKYREMRYDD